MHSPTARSHPTFRDKQSFLPNAAPNVSANRPTLYTTPPSQALSDDLPESPPETSVFANRACADNPRSQTAAKIDQSSPPENSSPCPTPAPHSPLYKKSRSPSSPPHVSHTAGKLPESPAPADPHSANRDRYQANVPALHSKTAQTTNPRPPDRRP